MCLFIFDRVLDFAFEKWLVRLSWNLGCDHCAWGQIYMSFSQAIWWPYHSRPLSPMLRLSISRLSCSSWFSSTLPIVGTLHSRSPRPRQALDSVPALWSREAVRSMGASQLPSGSVPSATRGKARWSPQQSLPSSTLSWRFSRAFNQMTQKYLFSPLGCLYGKGGLIFCHQMLLEALGFFYVWEKIFIYSFGYM